MPDSESVLFSDRQCGHCGAWMKTDGSEYWCPECNGCCSECERPLGDEYVRTETFAHPECAEEKYNVSDIA